MPSAKPSASTMSEGGASGCAQPVEQSPLAPRTSGTLRRTCFPGYNLWYSGGSILADALRLAMVFPDAGPTRLAEIAVNQELSIGALLGPYRIEGVLGAGGMGKVYRATDTRLGRSVAIK